MTQQGRVTQSTGQWYEVSYQKNGLRDTINCRLPGRFRQGDKELTNPIAVGDFVHFETNEDDTGSIEEIEKRQNYLIRESTHHQKSQQILAANIDGAYLIQSIKKPKPKQGFMDRFFVTCEAYQIPAKLVINKMDLVSDENAEAVRFLTDLYSSLGYPVLQTSIDNKKSLAALQESLKDQTSVFIGHSGVGKTSLLNHISPNIDRPVGEISDYNEKGKHTTTFAKLLPLEMGGYLVDTPGIKEFGLANVEAWELSLFFPEMLEPRKECKFNNCTHSHEPGCGVMEAFEQGDIHPNRYDSYLNILESLEG